jgi:NADP-dependent 3-hydroxy acid dehydrogenase YdfG
MASGSLSTPLLGKVFVVTGVASGMGLATATTLLQQGASVGLYDVSEDSLNKISTGFETSHADKVIA